MTDEASREAPRVITAHLADAGHKLPMPGTSRLFSAADEGERVDTWDPFWIALLKDGSVVEGPRSAAAPAPRD